MNRGAAIGAANKCVSRPNFLSGFSRARRSPVRPVCYYCGPDGPKGSSGVIRIQSNSIGRHLARFQPCTGVP
jgi:hypothetical protein